MVRIPSSLDFWRMKRRVAELVAAGASRPAAERRARAEIRKAKAQLKDPSVLGDWRANHLTREL